MIRLKRTELPESLSEQLARKHSRLIRDNVDGKAARSKWKNAKECKSGLREQLNIMAAGINRCMYCGDGMGTDIDHFEPILLAPMRTFDWPNHLLACSHCNSHEKREEFPRNEADLPLLIDPTSEDPTEHLILLLATGEYQALSAKGASTVQVFGLNRSVLVRGRRSAFVITKNVLRSYLRHFEAGSWDEAEETAAELQNQPFADVREAMRWVLRHSDRIATETVLGGVEVVRALELLPPSR